MNIQRFNLFVFNSTFYSFSEDEARPSKQLLEINNNL